MSGSLVCMYSFTLIAPFGSVSTFPSISFVFGRKPTHKMTISVSNVSVGVATCFTFPSSSVMNSVTFSPSARVTPRSVNSFSRISVNGLSRYLFKMRSNPSINVTCFPDSTKASTNSIPIYPPPTITTRFASFACAMISFAWL